MRIDGKKIAESIYSECEHIKPKGKFLALVRTNTTPATESFVRQKKIACERMGIQFQDLPFSEGLVRQLGNDKSCGGVILQLPLGDGVDVEKIVTLLPPHKDIDNLSKKAPILAPAVAAVSRIVKELGIQLKEKDVVAIGRGRLVGEPVFEWLKQEMCMRIRSYDEGFDIQELKSADIVISGTGKSKLFSAHNLKKGAIVIDFGYGVDEQGRVAGDFDPQEADGYDITYTPTPGGTGPILVACLMQNFCKIHQDI